MASKVVRSIFRVGMLRVQIPVLWLRSVFSKQDLVWYFPVMQVLRQSVVARPVVARPSAVARSASDAMLFAMAMRKVEMFQKEYLN